jgi:hypothetical protein
MVLVGTGEAEGGCRDRPTPRARRDVLTLFWVLAFIAHRALVLEWGFNRLFYWEESYRLIVAEALRDNWPIPLLDLQADPYAGGSLVVSCLAVPFFAAFGPSLAVLKWVVLLWSATGLAAWFVLVDRYVGRTAAHVFALGFVFAPPLFVIYNLIAMGSHAEVVTLSGVQFLLAFRFIYAARRSNLSLAAWGAFAGFSVWFTYVSVLPFAVALAVALAARALPPRRWILLGAAFLCGFAPWIVCNFETGWKGLRVIANTFFTAPSPGGRGGPGAYLATLFDLVKAGMPVALRYHDLDWSVGPLALRVPRAVPSYAYFAMFAAAWTHGMWRLAVDGSARPASRAWLAQVAASRPELALLLLYPLFTLMIAASNHGFNELGLVPFLAFRILVPALPAVFFALALTAARLSRRGCAGAVAVLAVLGAIATTQLVTAGASERPRLEREARALGAEAMGHLLVYKHGPDLPLIAERIAAMSEDLRSPAYRGIGFSLAYHYPQDAPVGGLVDEVLAVDRRYRSDVIEGIHLALGPGMEQVRPVPASEHTRAMLGAVDTLDAGSRSQ